MNRFDRKIFESYIFHISDYLKKILHIQSPINENGNSENGILKYLKMIANITSGVQKDFYNAMLSSSKPVVCKPLSEVFSKEEIKLIKKNIKVQPKQCYKNATLLMNLMPGVKYVEGYTEVCGIPIEHAFNKVGDDYVDITVELALKEDISKKQYVSFGEYDAPTVQKIIVKNEYYGDVFNTIFRQNYSK